MYKKKGILRKRVDVVGVLIHFFLKLISVEITAAIIPKSSPLCVYNNLQTMKIIVKKQEG